MKHVASENNGLHHDKAIDSCSSSHSSKLQQDEL